MRREVMAKLVLGCTGIFIAGSLTGLALADYVESGSFHFYREASASTWARVPTGIRPADFAAEPALDASHQTALLQQAAFDR